MSGLAGPYAPNSGERISLVKGSHEHGLARIGNLSRHEGRLAGRIEHFLYQGNQRDKTMFKCQAILTGGREGLKSTINRQS
jgi:hypothetical protein